MMGIYLNKINVSFYMIYLSLNINSKPATSHKEQSNPSVLLQQVSFSAVRLEHAGKKGKNNETL